MFKYLYKIIIKIIILQTSQNYQRFLARYFLFEVKLNVTTLAKHLQYLCNSLI